MARSIYVRRMVARNREWQRRFAWRLVVGDFWRNAPFLLPRWRNVCRNFVSMLACCAFCGATALGGCHDFQSFPAAEDIPPAGFQNVPLASHMISEQGHWWVCPGCINFDDREMALKYQSLLQPSYVRDVLSAGYRFSQMMSLVDVNLHMESNRYGVPSGWLQRVSIFEGPLYLGQENWSPNSFGNVFRCNMQYKPLLINFKCMLERGKDSGIPVLAVQALTGILSSAQRHGLSDYVMMQRNVEDQPFTSISESIQLLSNLGVSSGTYGLYEIGDVVRRNGDIWQFRCLSNGSSVGPFVGMAVSAECLLFPFLFPQGAGFFFHKGIS